MKCLHLKIRSKQYQKYFYCFLHKKTNPQCIGCKDKSMKIYEIKKRTSKQAKAERDRYSIFTNDLTKCIEGCSNKLVDKHEIYRGRNRHNSIKWGLVIPLCRECHNKSEIEFKWRIKGQLEFMKYYNKTIDEFREIFRINYLEIVGEEND